MQPCCKLCYSSIFEIFLMGWSKALFRIYLLCWLWPRDLQILGSIAYFCWQECIFHFSCLLFSFWPLAHPRRICLPPFSLLWFHHLVLIAKNSQEVGVCILALMKEKGKHTQEKCNNEQNAKYKLLLPILTSKQSKMASACIGVLCKIHVVKEPCVFS